MTVRAGVMLAWALLGAPVASAGDEPTTEPAPTAEPASAEPSSSEAPAKGDVPFYAEPYVQLRGVPAFRYVGTTALSVESELRWDFWRRWSVVTFGGIGAAVSERTLSGGSVAWGAGLGGRYLLARKLGMRAGIDVARGPEQFAFYVVAGSPWFSP